MHQLQKSLFFPLLLSTANTIHAGTISEISEKLLAKTPESAFQEAAAKNDLRILTVPYCDLAAPGFNFRDYKDKELKNNDLGLSCAALLGENEMEALLKLEAWVAKYNSLLHDKLSASQ
jgi:hypothetical protein